MVQTTNDEYICAEVYWCLNYLGDTYIEKIPKKLFEEIDNLRDKSVYLNIDEYVEFDEILSREALAVLAAIDYEFWSTPEEKVEKEKIYYENQKKHDEEIRAKYDVNNIFKQEEKKIEAVAENIESDIESNENIDESVNEITALVNIEDNFFNKIKNIIINLFNKIINKGE